MRMLFLADDDKGQNTIRGNQPPLHLPFNLNKSSAYVGLYGGEGSVRIDFYDIDDPTPLAWSPAFQMEATAGACLSAQALTHQTLPATVDCMGLR